MSLYDVSVLVVATSRHLMSDGEKATAERRLTVEAESPSDAAKAVLARFGDVMGMTV